MIKIIRGKYKNINMRVDGDFNIIIKCPKRVPDEKITEFISSHKRWISLQQERIFNSKQVLNNYDFDNFLYIFGKPYDKTGNKKSDYIELFNKYVIDLLNKISVQTGLSYNKVSHINSIRVWGSMDRNKHIKLNLKLLLLNEELVKYVIIHELCHTIEFNHSKSFWRAVEKFCPNYKTLVKELNKYSHVLKERVF